VKRFFNSFKSIKNWPEFWKFYYNKSSNYKVGPPFEVEFRGGLLALVPPILTSAFDEIFLREVYKFKFKNFTRNPVILDIGANVGYFSMYILSKYPLAKLIAFEPVPSNLSLLEYHKMINKLSFKIDTRAVMGTKKNVAISFNKNSKYSVSASVLERDTANFTINVTAMSIPDIFTENNIDHCELLKIDCEGAEYNILFNCPPEYLKKISNMVIEVHNWIPETEGSISKLTGYLKDQNFQVLNRKNEIIWCYR
jgi:FkbM family methyltransferase